MWFLAFLFVVVALLVRIPFMHVREAALLGDETIIGLMAKHILEGQLPIYFYAQSYMGSFEAYIAALFALGLGLNGWSAQLGAFFSYALFLVVHFFLIKKLWGLAASIFSTLLLVVPSVMVWEISVRAFGGSTEVLLFGALSFFLWIKVFSDKQKKWIFALGLSLGLGLWINPLFLIYLISLVVMTLYWRDGFRRRVKWLSPLRVFWLGDLKGPLWVKWILRGLHVFYLVYIAKQIFVFFTGPLTWKALGFDFSRPPFQWKGIRKILNLMTAEGVLLAYLVQGQKGILLFFRHWLPLILGFTAGYFPAIFHSLSGAEGYRLLHAAGTIRGHDIFQKLKLIYLELLPYRVFGVNTDFHSIALSEGLAGAWVLLIFTGAFIFYFFHFRKDWAAFYKLKRGIQKEGFFFCLLGLFTLLFNTLITLEADRYLLPFYWVAAVIAGFLLSKIYSTAKFKWGAVAMLLMLMGYYVAANIRLVLTFPEPDDIRGLARVLEKENIAGGTTDYENAYRLSFYSQENLKFIPFPLQGINRIPSYNAYVENLKRKAFIFSKKEDQERFLNRNPEFIPKEIKSFKNFVICVVENAALQ